MKKKPVKKYTNSDLLRFRVLTGLPELQEFKKLKYDIKDAIVNYIIEEIDLASKETDKE